jgi:hypothetical protein
MTKLRLTAIGPGTRNPEPSHNLNSPVGKLLGYKVSVGRLSRLGELGGMGERIARSMSAWRSGLSTIQSSVNIFLVRSPRFSGTPRRPIF